MNKHNFNNLFIFEMANNHQGSIAHALEIIRAAGEIARRNTINAAVKLQYRSLSTILHPDALKNGNKHAKRFRDTALSSQDFAQMVDAIKKEGMLAICTPFDEDSVQLCVEHGIDILKVASCSALDWPLLEAIAKTNKPVIHSTGGITCQDIDRIYNFYIHREVEFAILHCVGLYPAPPEKLQLGFIQKLIHRYPGIPIGYSGHEAPDCTIVPQLAAAKGATIFERHFGIPYKDNPLNAYSSTPEQADTFVRQVLYALEICGSDTADKTVSLPEKSALRELSRGTYAAQDIPAGEPVEQQNVFFAIPCQENQLSSGAFHSGMISSCHYTLNAPITEIVEENATRSMRSYIHQIKSTLNEAHISVQNFFQMELSHHYGLENFSRFGIAMINVLNREYCKKIIVLLPGQENPSHYHQKKEEAFQVLEGKLTLTIDGQTMCLLPGEVAVVERKLWHSFHSEDGCIFEEISTTHFRDDSIYADETINHMDPMQRKTILTEW